MAEERGKKAMIFSEIAEMVENDPEVARQAEKDQREIGTLTAKDLTIVFTI